MKHFKQFKFVNKCYNVCDEQKKCEHYWPESEAIDLDFASVTLISTEEWPDYVISRLKLSKVKK